MQMEAEVLQVKGLSLIGKGSSGHWVPMDTKAEFGGSEAGATPMELLLLSLCGCTQMDVISILDKMRVPYEYIRVKAVAERSEEHPKKFTKVHINYVIKAKEGQDVPPAKVEKAIGLSEEKYCSVSATLKPGLEIVTDYQIE